MIAHYGYSNGTGEFYITIDTDKCDGCGECVGACPKDVFELTIDDYDRQIATIKNSVVRSIGYICPGKKCYEVEKSNCHKACKSNAISHSW